MRPAFSIVIPTFQRRAHVVRAVYSALAQTFRDFEIVVVDDGSTDGTRASLQQLDPRVRYLWQPNRGVAAARNAGIHAARGSVVAFLDSDDRWRRDHLATLWAALERHPDAVLASVCPCSTIQGRERGEDARLVDTLPRMLLESFVGYPTCVAVRCNALAAVGGFDEELVVMEDHRLYLRLAMVGPFALLRRGTVVHQATRHSLVSRSADQLAASRRIAAQVVNEVARLSRPDRDDLVERARGRASFVEAIALVLTGGAERARFHLSDACRRLPDLSVEAELVARRLGHVSDGRHEQARNLERLAAIWPHPHARTPRFLRTLSAALLLLEAQPSAALDALRADPGCIRPSALLATRREWARFLRRGLHALRHRGTDDMAAAPGQAREA